jgi:hypothetical protein
VFDERPHWPGRDADVKSWRRCVVTAHDKAVAGSWRGGLGWGACEGAQARAAARRVRNGARMARAVEVWLATVR